MRISWNINLIVSRSVAWEVDLCSIEQRISGKDATDVSSKKKNNGLFGMAILMITCFSFG